VTYLSVCSGIEAATVAAHRVGWEPWAFAEVDAFPSAVLKHHYPNVPNLGDMTKFQEWPDAAIDLLVGGTPCQSFSVAGLRAGLADPRGNLALVYLALADRYRPRWVVWENVPGVLSSAGGRDFGAFLGGLGELGYGFAYRVLDAQYFGLAQRRKRVFVVGHLGDWRRAAAVLFERASLSGHPAPRRETGQDVAPTIAARTRGGGGLGTDFDCDGGLITGALTVRGCDSSNAALDEGRLIAFGGNNTAGPIDVATAVNAHGGPCGRMDFESETFIAHALPGEGFDASEDGTGRGTPLVPVAFDTTQITSKVNRSNPQPGDPCHPLAAGAHPPAVAFHNRQDPDVSGAVTHPLGAKDNGLAIAFSAKDYGGDEGDLAPTLRAGGHTTSHANGGVMPAVATSMQVRRLTPRERCRLQGFPDDYLDIPYRGKPAADGPKYKALGNSMAVPVMRWIFERIGQVDAIRAERRGA